MIESEIEQQEAHQRVFGLPLEVENQSSIEAVAVCIEERAERVSLKRLGLHTRGSLMALANAVTTPNEVDLIEDADNITQLFAWWEEIVFQVLLFGPHCSETPIAWTRLAKEVTPQLLTLCDQFFAAWSEARRKEYAREFEGLTFQDVRFSVHNLLKAYLAFTDAVRAIAVKLFPGFDLTPLLELV